MNIEHVKTLTPTERFLYWINERESIRIQKEENLPKPWTDDSILQTYKFCNVRRMDDRVSQWLWKNWYEPNFDHPNMVTAVTLARQLNNTDSLGEVGFPYKWAPKIVEQILNKRVSEKKKNFAAAYMITGTLGGTKIQQIVYKVVTPLHDKVKDGHFPTKRDTMQDFWKMLIPFAGFSSFMAGQVVADLRWSISGNWKDRAAWAPMGPGSKRGLNRLLGLDKNTKMSSAKFNVEFDFLLDFCYDRIPVRICKRLEAMDIQNCLCEFDKYERTLWEGRRPKQRYNGIA